MNFFKRLIFGNSADRRVPERERRANNRRTAEPERSATLPKHAEAQVYRFIAVDVETANSNVSSICQIGVAFVDADGLVNAMSYLVDPEQDFDAFNSNLHGIDAAVVRGAPTFAAVLQFLRPVLERHVLVQHSGFDRKAFDDACRLADIPALRCEWFNSVTIARRAWPELKGQGGHGLANLKNVLGLEFEHHDAGEDARAAAEVVLLAEAQTGQNFIDLAASSSQRRGKWQTSIALDGEQNGAHFGHVACFTGRLSLSRVEAATIAAGAGISVKTSMSKKVTLLVVGDIDLADESVQAKSSKQQRAEELIAQGHPLRIIGETEFMDMVSKP